MKRYRLLLLITTCLVFQPLLSDITFATETKKEEKKLEELEKQQEGTEKELKQSVANLKKQKAEVQKIEEAVTKLDQEINKLNQQNQKNQALLQQQRKILEQRVIKIYQGGEMGFMVQLLQAESFSQFLARLQGIRLIVKSDSAQIQKFKETKKKIETTKASIEAKKKKQQPLLAQASKKLAKIEKDVASLKGEISEIKHDVEATKEQIDAKNAAVKQASANFSGNYGSGQLMRPVSGPITSPFGYRWGRPHEGVDFGGGMGTPIYAADSGVVSLIKSDPGGYGIYIVISHGNSLSTLYAHMYRSTITVSPGQKVSKGQKIAEIGNNGRSTGPHLHFEVHKGGTPVNPVPYFN